MVKWEYLMIYHLRNGYWLQVAPAGRISFQELSKEFKFDKVQYAKDENSDALGYYDSRVYHVLVDYLCAEGWEPFAATDETLHFRRQTLQA